MGFIEIVGIGVALLVGLVAVWQFMNSADWREINGVILNSNIKKIYNNVQTNDFKSAYDYYLDIEYEYHAEGMTKKGSKIYPGLPNLFSSISEAEKILELYPIGKNIRVYINPNNSDDASLIIATKNQPYKFVLVVVVVVLFIGVFIVALNFANKIMSS